MGFRKLDMRVCFLSVEQEVPGLTFGAEHGVQAEPDEAVDLHTRRNTQSGPGRIHDSQCYTFQ